MYFFEIDVQNDHECEKFKDEIRGNLTLYGGSDILYEIILYHINRLNRPQDFPKIMEMILDCRVDTSNFNTKYLIESYSSLFGYAGAGYNVSDTMTLVAARMMLQNPMGQMKGIYIGNHNENFLHSIVHTIHQNLNSSSGRFFYEEYHIERENCKKSSLLLFTLMVLTAPHLLEQKSYNLLSKPGFPKETTPMKLLEGYNSLHARHGIHHPYIQELYDRFREIIELTKSDTHNLSQRIRELINYINYASGRKRLLDANELEEKVGKIRQGIESQGSTPAEECIANVGRFITKNLPVISLDSYCSSSHRNLLKRSMLERFYELNVGNINAIFGRGNFDVFSEVLKNFDEKTLSNLIEAVFGKVLAEDLNGTLLQNLTLMYVNDSTIITNLEDVVKNHKKVKMRLQRIKEKDEHEKVSEEALGSVRYLMDSYQNIGTDIKSAIIYHYDRPSNLLESSDAQGINEGLKITRHT